MGFSFSRRPSTLSAWEFEAQRRFHAPRREHGFAALGQRRGAGRETRPPRERPSGPPATARRPSRRRAVAAKAPSHPSRRRWLRWALFLLLPLALIAGGYWYVTGGR